MVDPSHKDNLIRSLTKVHPHAPWEKIYSNNITWVLGQDMHPDFVNVVFSGFWGGDRGPTIYLCLQAEYFKPYSEVNALR